jgi:hypothetical protein
MKAIVLFACALAMATPASAQTVEELKAQLEAQAQINELLKQRIRTLEAEAANHTAQIAAAPVPAARPEGALRRGAGDPEEDRALERALVRRGIVVLAPYVAEITPGMFWSHSGSDVGGSSDDLFGATLDARIGLPGGWMLGGQVPFLHRSSDAFGNNTGPGDISATIWKQITAQDGAWPSVVGSIRYTAPTGDDFSEELPPLGSGFHRITGRLSAVKSVDPIAFFGDLSYTHNFTTSFSGVEINRSGVFGVGAGASLAVTPDISLTAGLNFAFEGDAEADGPNISGSGTTIGLVELGAGVVLSKDVFLNFTGALGITDDSPDVILGVSLPIRF